MSPLNRRPMCMIFKVTSNEVNTGKLIAELEYMRITYFIKLGLTIILLVVLFTKVNLSEVIGILSSLNILYYLIAILFVPILYLIRTFRWKILLESIEIRNSFTNLYKVLIIGVFYGLITPGKVGELGRAYHLKGKKTKIFPTIIIEKITDIFALILLSIITIFLFFNNYPGFKLLISVCIFVMIFGIWILSSKRITYLLVKPLKVQEENVDLFIDSFSKMIKNKNIMFKTFILAFCYYFVNYIAAIFLLASLDIVPSVVVVLPLVILMGNIPLTISGLGLRESVGAICFIMIGESGAHGVSFSVLFFITVTLLPGIAGYFLTMSEQRIEPSEV